MKRTILVVLVVLGLLVVPFAASAQTAPPPGGTPPATGGGNNSGVLVSSFSPCPYGDPTTDPNAAALLSMGFVYRYCIELVEGENGPEFGSVTTAISPCLVPGGAATCDPSSGVEVQYWMKPNANLETAGDNWYYTECARRFNEFNQQLQEMGLWSAIIIGGCTVFAVTATAAAACTAAIDLAIFFEGAAATANQQQKPILAMVYHDAAALAGGLASTFCAMAAL